MPLSVGTFSVGAPDEDALLQASQATIIINCERAVLTRAAAIGTVDVDESDRIMIEPGWAVMEIDLTVDVTLS